MKARIILAFYLFSILTIVVNAQIPQPALPRDITTRISIDTARLQVTYLCKIRRVLHTKSYHSDMQVLEVGKRYIRYYSDYAEIIDSLDHIGKGMYLGKGKEGTYEDIYIDYPKKNTMSVYCRFLNKTLVYQEPIPIFNWKITSEIDTILNYPCIKATAKFRGREYNVWFTVDIPIRYGPWKFGGLPGLILRVEDTEQYFTYEAIGINQRRDNPIFIYTEKAQKCKRKDVLRLNDLRWIDDEFLIKITHGKETVSFAQDEYGNAVVLKNKKKVVIPQKELE